MVKTEYSFLVGYSISQHIDNIRVVKTDGSREERKYQVSPMNLFLVGLKMTARNCVFNFVWNGETGLSVYQCLFLNGIPFTLWTTLCLIEKWRI